MICMSVVPIPSKSSGDIVSVLLQGWSRLKKDKAEQNISWTDYIFLTNFKFQPTILNQFIQEHAFYLFRWGVNKEKRIWSNIELGITR